MATKLPYVLPFEDGSVVAAILLKAQGLPETEQIATKTELQQATAYLATLDNATMAPQSAAVKRETDNLQAQIDNIVRAPESGGDVGAEVAQARVASDGTNYPTLKARLDANEQSLDDSINSISEIKSETVVLNAISGYFTSTVLQYWNASGHKIVYFACEGNKRYKITKTLGNEFEVCYITAEPTSTLPIPVYNYTQEAAATGSVEISTGTGAKYILILANNGGISSDDIKASVSVSAYSARDDIARNNIETVFNNLETVSNSLSDVTEVIGSETVTNPIAVTWSPGYIGADGTSGSASTLQHSNEITVGEGDIISASRNLRFIAAYDENNAIVPEKEYHQIQEHTLFQAA